MNDEMELAWWREVFACRFRPGNLPKPGTPLYGARLKLLESDPDGDYYEWQANQIPPGRFWFAREEDGW